jgi:hypothetical protein
MLATCGSQDREIARRPGVQAIAFAEKRRHYQISAIAVFMARDSSG